LKKRFLSQRIRFGKTALSTGSHLRTMKNSVVFPLKTSTVFSRNPKETFDVLDRLLKNSLLFFEEIWIEGGSYQVTYGDTFGLNFSFPFEGVDKYKKFKKLYESAGAEKRQAMFGIKPEGAPQAEWTTVESSLARSYYVSLQGALDCLLETHSKKDLDFVKFFGTADSQIMKKIVSDMSWKYRRIPEIKDKLEQVCNKWDIGILSTNRIVEESISTAFLSRACNSPPIVDGLHKDVLGSLDNIRREIQGEYLQIDTVSKVLQIAIPDYSKFTLSKILELRKEPSLKEFRKAVTEIARNLDGTADKEPYVQITQEINKCLMKDVKAIAPKGKTNVVLSAAIDCILSVPVPPEYTLPLWLASIGKTAVTAIGGTIKTDRWNNSFGCFWMKLAN